MSGWALAALIANHLVGLLLWRAYTAKEVGTNVKMIEADGSGQTLNAGFHQRRTWLRFWNWLACVGIGCVVAVFVGWHEISEAMPYSHWYAKPIYREFWQPQGWSFAALGVLLAGYFLRTFSPSLNAAMGLDYKPRFYVSLSATASLLDRFTVWLAGKLKISPDTLFQRLLNVALVLTLVVYVALLLPLLSMVQR